jgi:hypothetical protein
MLNLMHYSLTSIKCLLIVRNSKACIRSHLHVKNFDISFKSSHDDSKVVGSILDEANGINN